MSLAAKVRSIEALQEWKTCLNCYAGETRQVLHSVERMTQQAEEWIQERVHHWRRTVEQCQEGVRQAATDLRQCRDDGDSDCGAEEEGLAVARSNLASAEMELESARRWNAEIAERAVAYRLHAERLARLLDIDMPRADAFLGRAVNDLHRYITEITLAESVTAPLVDVEQTRQIDHGLAALRMSHRGEGIYSAIVQRGVSVEFGYIPNEIHCMNGKQREFMVAAQYDPGARTITVNIDLKGKPVSVIAAYLAHEGIHVQWDHGQQKPSLEEEYEAHKAQAAVWQEIKGSQHHQGHEQVATMISLEVHEAKAQIRSDYGDDYFSDVFGDTDS